MKCGCPTSGGGPAGGLTSSRWQDAPDAETAGLSQSAPPPPQLNPGLQRNIYICMINDMAMTSNTNSISNSFHEQMTQTRFWLTGNFFVFYRLRIRSVCYSLPENNSAISDSLHSVRHTSCYFVWFSKMQHSWQNDCVFVHLHQWPMHHVCVLYQEESRIVPGTGSTH